MAKADDMASARPMYLDAMESANGIPREARILSCRKKKKEASSSRNVLVLNHAERVVSRMMEARVRATESVVSTEYYFFSGSLDKGRVANETK